MNGSSCPHNRPQDNKTHICLSLSLSVCVCVCVCLCVCRPIISTISKCSLSYSTSLQQYPHCSNVWSSASCGLSSLSAQHQDFIQSFSAPYRTLHPHLPAPSPVQGPLGGRACHSTWRWSDRHGALCMCVYVCVCVCVICTFRGGSLCSVGLDASFGSGLLRPLCDVVSLPSAESEPLYLAG